MENSKQEAKTYKVKDATGEETTSTHPAFSGDLAFAKGDHMTWSAAGKFRYVLSSTVNGYTGPLVTFKNVCKNFHALESCTRGQKCMYYHLDLGVIASNLPGRNPVPLGMLNPRFASNPKLKMGQKSLIEWPDIMLVEIGTIKEGLLRDVNERTATAAIKRARDAEHNKTYQEALDLAAQIAKPPPKRICMARPEEVQELKQITHDETESASAAPEFASAGAAPGAVGLDSMDQEELELTARLNLVRYQRAARAQQAAAAIEREAALAAAAQEKAALEITDALDSHRRQVAAASELTTTVAAPAPSSPAPIKEATPASEPSPHDMRLIMARLAALESEKEQQAAEIERLREVAESKQHEAATLRAFIGRVRPKARLQASKGDNTGPKASSDSGGAALGDAAQEAKGDATEPEAPGVEVKLERFTQEEWDEEVRRQGDLQATEPTLDELKDTTLERTRRSEPTADDSIGGATLEDAAQEAKGDDALDELKDITFERTRLSGPTEDDSIVTCDADGD
jgi:hypothetical protein